MSKWQSVRDAVGMDVPNHFLREDTRTADRYHVAREIPSGDWIAVGTFWREGRSWRAEHQNGLALVTASFRACVRWICSNPQPNAHANTAPSPDMARTRAIVREWWMAAIDNGGCPSDPEPDMIKPRKRETPKDPHAIRRFVGLKRGKTIQRVTIHEYNQEITIQPGAAFYAGAQDATHFYVEFLRRFPGVYRIPQHACAVEHALPHVTKNEKSRYDLMLDEALAVERHLRAFAHEKG